MAAAAAVSLAPRARGVFPLLLLLLLGPWDGLRERGGDGGGGVPLVCLVVLWPFEEEEEEEGVLTVAGEGKRRYYGMEE